MTGRFVCSARGQNIIAVNDGVEQYAKCNGACGGKRWPTSAALGGSPRIDCCGGKWSQISDRVTSAHTRTERRVSIGWSAL